MAAGHGCRLRASVPGSLSVVARVVAYGQGLAERYAPSALSLPNPALRPSRNEFLSVRRTVFGPLPFTRPRAATPPAWPLSIRLPPIRLPPIRLPPARLPPCEPLCGFSSGVLVLRLVYLFSIWLFQSGEMLFLSHSIREITDFIRVKLSFAGTKQYKRHFRPVFRSPMAQV